MRKILILFILFPLTACAQFTIGKAHSPSIQVSVSNLQNSATNWTNCGTTLCAGGAGNSSALSETPGIASPSLSGASMALTYTSPATGNNALFIYKPVATCDTCKTAHTEIHVYLPSGVANFEYDHSIVTTTLDGSFGHQCNRTTGFWQYSGQTSLWIDSAIPCTLTLGAWHTLVFDDYWNPEDTSCAGGFPVEHFGTLEIDGVVNSWGVTVCAETIPAGWTHTLVSQVQMDSNSAATLTEYIDYMNISFGL